MTNGCRWRIVSNMTEIVLTKSFEKSCKKLLDKNEVKELIAYLAENPKAGDVIQQTNGLRKVRWAAKGKGKRGGARVITYFYQIKDRVFVLYAYRKNKQENLSTNEKKALKALVNVLRGK